MMPYILSFKLRDSSKCKHAKPQRDCEFVGMPQSSGRFLVTTMIILVCHKKQGYVFDPQASGRFIGKPQGKGRCIGIPKDKRHLLVCHKDHGDLLV